MEQIQKIRAVGGVSRLNRIYLTCFFCILGQTGPEWRTNRTGPVIMEM